MRKSMKTILAALVLATPLALTSCERIVLSVGGIVLVLILPEIHRKCNYFTCHCFLNVFDSIKIFASSYTRVPASRFYVSYD